MAHRRLTPPQFYDEETGAPIDGGCRRGSDCYFVHPSQAQWASARLAKQNYRGERNGGADYGKRDRDRDRGDREDRHREDRRSSHGLPADMDSEDPQHAVVHEGDRILTRETATVTEAQRPLGLRRYIRIYN